MFIQVVKNGKFSIFLWLNNIPLLKYLFERMFSFSLDKYAEVVLLENMVVLFLKFWELSNGFP